MTRRISMFNGMQVAQQATCVIENWLKQLPQTRQLKNVEKDSFYQKKDVDLLWSTDKKTHRIEIKADRWHQTGNFFFETHSNYEKGTPGCFMYTEADWLFYYFIEPKVLYILPMPIVRYWFLDNIQHFSIKKTTTPIGQSYYTTVGRLVPIASVLQAFNNIKSYHL